MLPEFKPHTSPIVDATHPANALGNGSIHIWRLDLRLITSELRREALACMSQAERERAEKFKRGKEEYIACRWLLRQVLAIYTGVATHELQIQRSEKGKPYLARSNIQFSLSHSNHWAILAVSEGQAIGIDVETIQAQRDITGIAQHYYHPAELAALLRLSGGAQQDYFYRLWTLKEAFFKALGSGISAGLDKIAFTMNEQHISAVIDAALETSGTDWQFQQWQLAPQVYCALAHRYEKTGQQLSTKWFDALALPAFP